MPPMLQPLWASRRLRPVTPSSPRALADAPSQSRQAAVAEFASATREIPAASTAWGGGVACHRGRGGAAKGAGGAFRDGAGGQASAGAGYEAVPQGKACPVRLHGP